MVFKIRTLILPIPRTREDLLVIHGSPLRKFSWHELKVATGNFNTENIVGRGGFGKVYRGILWDGSVVAVKRLDKDSFQGELEFQAEVLIRSCQASNQRNVLRLRGYCMTKKERLLVYPFMVNGSVASRLRDRPESEPPLDWGTRKRIALGAAKGLAHFHYGTSFKVIHRDIKASNILLDDQFEAHLGDFGLAKFVDRSSHEELNPLSDSGWVRRPMEEEDGDSIEDDSDDDKHNCFTVSCWNFTKTILIAKSEDEDEEAKGCTKCSCMAFSKNQVISVSDGNGSSGGTFESRGGSEAQAQAWPNYDFTHVETLRVCGTKGYMAPEYLVGRWCSVKSDVFGYGITLLELITGKGSFHHLPNEVNVWLLDWVKELVRDNKLELVIDPDLRADYIKEEVEQLLQVALLCTQVCPMERPVMSEVIEMIENIGNTSPSHDLLSSWCWRRLVSRISPIPSSTNPTPTDQEAECVPAATGWATFDRAGCVWVASDQPNWVQFESTHEIEPAQPQPEPLHEVFEPPPPPQMSINNAATLGTFISTFKFNKLFYFLLLFLLVISLSMNIVCIGLWARRGDTDFGVVLGPHVRINNATIVSLLGIVL